ncbi:hypothetical protein BP5796_05677 [Coleophoma crateriformis]|uniref:Major facilitator superfamily (MFS) profile domain-containing protein n=1 Tax=Coleophoma crateriformis TaxID=565419 RepID=A0A3D8S3W2_9HELO|nr:hypothetical protein BP5796_05677 [Coleophoma crateriformis]
MGSNSHLDANGKKLVVYIFCVATINALLQGYDQGMMNGINILPAYLNYFHMTTTSSVYALNTSILYLGTIFTTPVSTYVANRFGRKWGLRLAAMLGVVGTCLQAGAVHVSMFIIGRFIIGAAVNTGFVVAPAYIAETMHPSYRVFMVGFSAASWYLGSIIASFVVYGTQHMDSGLSNWTWRLPSILQLLPSFMCLAVLPFVPESPRWLVYQDRAPEALEILVKYHGNGIQDAPIVVLQYSEIVETLQLESANQTTGWKELIRTPENRRRAMLCATLGIMMYFSGNTIVSYYLGDVLDAAGITAVQTQLAVNIGFSIWGYLLAIIGSVYADKMGRRPAFLACNIVMAVMLLIQGVLTKVYANKFTPGLSGAIVLIIFLFNGAYSIAITPLGYIYPSEICNYSLRANGVALNELVAHLAGFATTYWTPYAMKKAWIYYIVVAIWDVLQAIFVWFYFPETKGLALEEVDAIFGRDIGDVKVMDVLAANDKMDSEKGVNFSSEQAPNAL